MDRNQGRNVVVRHLTDEELAGVSGGVTELEIVLNAAAQMRGIAYPCLSLYSPITIREGYICNK